MTDNKTIVSGVQTSGNLHLGNYLGAIANWVKLQDQGKCYFFLADLHAITVKQNPHHLRQATFETIATYLACGLDPKTNIIFKQSDVPQHAELAWLFNCLTPIGWLNRMTQFKDKVGKNRDKASLGLYAYPVLMVADILLYRPHLVPVGEDQKQHLELCRDLAISFNQQFNTDYFYPPEPLIMGTATRVMSLRDGAKKMSKSDESDYSRINLTDDADTIALKVKKAKSDPEPIAAENLEQRPELKNLATIIASLTNNTTAGVIDEFTGKGFKELKTQLSEILINQLAPISSEINRLLQDQSYLKSHLDNGAEQARNTAATNLTHIKQIFGLW